MGYLGMLTPEQAELEWGIRRSGELVITPISDSKSVPSSVRRSKPSSDGKQTSEPRQASAESSLRTEDSSSAHPMQPVADGMEQAIDDPMRRKGDTP